MKVGSMGERWRVHKTGGFSPFFQTYRNSLKEKVVVRGVPRVTMIPSKPVIGLDLYLSLCF